MAQVQHIKRRIRSVESTKQITRAMKMVAAAKLQRAQQRMLAMRPYADRLQATLRYLSTDLVGDEHPLFLAREPKRALTIVIAGDRGLCGGFNTNIARKAKEHVASLPDREHEFVAIGKRAVSDLRKSGTPVFKAYHDVFEKLSYVLAGEICDILVERYQASGADRIDEAYLVYNEFVNTITQRPVVSKLLPLDPKAIAEEHREELKEDSSRTIRPVYEVEPDTGVVMERLISRLLATRVYRGTLESFAAEQAARMTAMDNATNNAEEMIESLTLTYNRARQTAITSELMDIVGGANALG